jgi:hypothetical protein
MTGMSLETAICLGEPRDRCLLRLGEPPGLLEYRCGLRWLLRNASSLSSPLTGVCWVSGDLAGMDERRRDRAAAELSPFSSPLPLRRCNLIAHEDSGSHSHRRDNRMCKQSLDIWTKGWYGLVGHADANRHALLNTRNLPVYLTCRHCQQTQTLNLLVVVQGQCAMGCAADGSGMEGGFSAP